MTSVRILIVRAEEPDEAGLACLAARLREMGHTVLAGTAGEAADQAARARPDLALIDLGSEGAAGEAAAADAVGAAERLARGFDLPVIYLTGSADGARLQRARLTEPCGYLLKPIDDRQLRLTMEAALAMHDRDRARRQTIDELQQRTQTMETVLDLVGDGVVVADERGDLSIFNASAERIIGMTKADGGPDRWGDGYGLFHADEATPAPADELPLERAIRGEACDAVELFVRNPNRPDGVYISVTGRPLHGVPGRERGVVVFHDVTEQVRAEQEVSRAFAQGRLEVVETIVHNIGNAINSVAVGMGTIREKLLENEVIHRMFALADALRAHQDDMMTYLQTDPQGQQAMPFILALAEDLQGWYEGMHHTVERVEDRVSHIVDIIRTQRSLDFESMARKHVDLRRAIGTAVRLLDDSLARRGIDLRIDCERAPPEIRIRESAFHQLLVNLVRNAMEAIDRLAAESSGPRAPPSIRISAYARGDALVLDVIDNGVGIEPDLTTMVFAAGYTTKDGGSGIGLHSAANFVIGSGGSIQALSDGIGAGATIRVTLPDVSAAAPDGSARRGGSAVHETSVSTGDEGA